MTDKHMTAEQAKALAAKQALDVAREAIREPKYDMDRCEAEEQDRHFSNRRYGRPPIGNRPRGE